MQRSAKHGNARVSRKFLLKFIKDSLRCSIFAHNEVNGAQYAVVTPSETIRRFVPGSPVEISMIDSIARKTASFFSAWMVLLPSLALSEPYRVGPGDTLTMIAKSHSTTVAKLKQTNHLPDANHIRVGQVLIIPEGASEIVRAAGPQGAVVAHGAHRGSADRAVVHAAGRDSSRIITLRRNLENGWVATRNPDGKIFVHAQSSGGMLSDLRYVIRESPDGQTWSVYRPIETSRGTRYGRPVGVMPRPPDVAVGECTCQ